MGVAENNNDNNNNYNNTVRTHAQPGDRFASVLFRASHHLSIHSFARPRSCACLPQTGDVLTCLPTPSRRDILRV